jgi:hypothetical protein
MKKIILIVILNLILLFVAFTQIPRATQPVNTTEPQKIEQEAPVDQNQKEVQVSDTSETTDQSEYIAEKRFELQKYDAEINNLINSDYFERKTSPDRIICSNNIDDEIKISQSSIRLYGVINLNGTNYDKQFQCTISGQDCVKEINEEQQQIQKVVNANRFNLINGCLYDGKNKALNYNLFTYMHTEYFGQKIENPMEVADEWFRFEDDNNLYVYLSGAGGCGGCIFNGQYLKIDLESGLIEGKYSDLPFLPYLILSPNKKVAIEATFDKDSKNAKLYVFDFLTNSRQELVYTVSEDVTIFTQGDGVYVVNDAINWEDDSRLMVQLYEKDTEGFAKYKLIDNVTQEFITSGAPISIKVVY